jgi:inorganic pyrophosphatase
MSFPKPFFRFRPHPWHGVDVGPDSPRVVHAYIEITPFDTIKYEVDKTTGYLRVDRPQEGSSMPPTLYGFIPRTYCHDRVGTLAGEGIAGDGDPLDICVLSERPIARAEILLNARVVGGLKVVDRGEADDKIIAVLDNDRFWANAFDINDIPDLLVQRLVHYFSTYKLQLGQAGPITVQSTYGREEAFEVIRASIKDYDDVVGG